jgi:hypothetical protein
MSADIRDYLDAVLGTAEGWLTGGIGVGGHFKNGKYAFKEFIPRFYLKISRLPEFIADERRSGELGFDSGGTVGAVAACRAVTPGSSVPGWLLLPWGRLDGGPRVRGWRGRG